MAELLSKKSHPPDNNLFSLPDLLSLDVVPEFLKSPLFFIHRNVAFIIRKILYKPFGSKNVTFHLLSKEKPEAIHIHRDNLVLIAERQRKIVFIIHGWLNSRTVEWYDKMTTAFLKTYGDEYCVVQVDWEDLAMETYYVSSIINIYDVGKCNHITYVIVQIERYIQQVLAKC